MRYVIALIVLALAIGVVIGRLHQLAAPVAVPDPGGARIHCVSYAPYRRAGESPLGPAAWVSAERVAADLAIISRFSDCVRTYSVDHGLDAVPEIAERFGMRVLMGVWIGRDAADNAAQIALALDVLRTRPSSVDAVVVGNEVLLRRELTAVALAALIAEVRAATDIPVTYADVWEFWLKHPKLADAVDFISVHILPYWEDEPVAVGQAVEHVRDTLARVADAFPGRSVFIGETGWPSAGRMRGPAVPGVVEQAHFVREWVHAASRDGIAYNLIEAFDQPWKRHLEGAMGGRWGLLDTDGQVKFAWRGPVRAAPGSVARAALVGGVFAIVFALTAWLLLRRTVPTVTLVGAVAVAGLSGLLAGLLLPLQWQYLSIWSRDVLEWLFAGLYTLAGLLAALLLAPVLADARRRDGVVLRLWSGLRGLLLFGCAYFVLLHLFDARYRGFAHALYLLPAVVLPIAWIGGVRVPAAAVDQRLMGLLVLLGLPLLLWSESLRNTQALAFVVLAGLVGSAVLGPDRRPPGHRPVRPNRPSSMPNAPGSIA